jgi:SAM-dependent methyltransferase
MKVLSPITHSENTSIIEKIDSKKIVELYHKDYGIDVNRFFLQLPEVHIYQCNDTGYRFYYPFSLYGDDKLYEDLQSVSDVYYSKTKWEFEIAKRHIKSNDVVLDVGCGAGFFLEGIKSKTPNLHGLEFNDMAIEKCRIKNINVSKSFVEDYASIESNVGVFDVVSSFQVLEHVYKIDAYLRSSLKLLKKGGTLIIGVPHSNPFLYKNDILHTLNLPPHHMGLWNKAAFENLTKYYPMTIEQIYIEPLWDIEYWLKINYGWNIKLPIFLKVIYMKFFSSFFQGRNIVAVFKKTLD